MAKIVHLLDYGAGNVRSVRNAITTVGYQVIDVEDPGDLEQAEIVVFPGVGNLSQAMAFLDKNGYGEALKKYIQQDKKFLGICLGMQALFEGSEECPEAKGLGVIKGQVRHFPVGKVPVPHIGWNGTRRWKDSPLFTRLKDDADRVYFVHTYRVMPCEENKEWVLTTTNYGEDEFISSIQKGNVMATQFHPEKSGQVGLEMIRAFLDYKDWSDPLSFVEPTKQPPTVLAKRIIACLDVRTNDDGDLVVTKGDQYDVREADGAGGNSRGNVRNLGKPVDLCERYYKEGADEVAFLNICSFREEPLGDLPMLRVLELSSQKVFVPLTIGGGIRGYVDSTGRKWSAVDVASQYFRAGADKVSIGSDAVYAAEEHFAKKEILTGDSAIEQISKIYGKQAVVVSMDPRRVYVDPSDASCEHTVIELEKKGPNGETHCWYQATVRGGREGRNIDAFRVAKACERLGAGEILLNCVDMDGQKQGYDHDLILKMKKTVQIPVIASSGAGNTQHFTDVFEKTNCDAALAAGIFHRHEVDISDVKQKLNQDQIPSRLVLA